MGACMGIPKLLKGVSQTPLSALEKADLEVI